MGKPRLKYEKYKELLFDELNKGSSVSTKKTNFYELLRTKYSVSKQNALSYYDKAYLEWTGLRNIDKEYKSSFKKETNAKIKTGIKTKIDRLLIYQKQVNKINRILDGKENATFILNGKVTNSLDKKGTLILPIQIIVTLQKTLKDLQSEISKIEGDYAPNKQEVDVLTTERRIILPDGTTLEDYDKRFNL